MNTTPDWEKALDGVDGTDWKRQVISIISHAIETARREEREKIVAIY